MPPPADHPLDVLLAPVPYILYQGVEGSQTVLRRRGQDAYAAVCEMLRACTDWDGVWHRNTIHAHPACEHVVLDEQTNAIVAEITRTLGSPKPGITIRRLFVIEDALGGYQPTRTDPNPSSEGAPSRDAGEVVISDWDIPNERHDWAVGRVLAAPPAKRGAIDALDLSCSAEFRVREPPGGAILPGQHEGSFLSLACIRSEVMLHVSSGNTSVSLTLSFPFAEPDAAFVSYVERIRPYLPIRLAKNSFRHMRLNKAGNGYVVRRVPRALFEHI